MTISHNPYPAGKPAEKRPSGACACRGDMVSAEQSVPPVARILVSEDSPEIQQIYGVVLPDHGFEMLSVPGGDGGRTLDLIHRVRPHLLITDINKPGLDGYTLHAMLRADDGTAHLPVLMVTAMDTWSLPQRLPVSPVDDYIVKPFPFEALVYRIATLLPLSPAAHNELARRALGLACFDYFHPVTGLPCLHMLARALPTYTASAGWAAASISLAHYAALSRAYGRQVSDGLLARLAGIVRRAAEESELLIGHLGFEPQVSLVGPADPVKQALATIAERFARIRTPLPLGLEAPTLRLDTRYADDSAGTNLGLLALRAALM